MSTLLIGIDPDKGYAERMLGAPMCKRILTTNLMQLLSFIEQLESLAQNRDWRRIVIFLEAPYLNRSINASTLRQIPGGENGKELTPKTVGILLDAGKNLGKAETLRDFILARAKHCELVESRPDYFSRTKWPAAKFDALNYYNGKTSEHGRDAAMLLHPANRSFANWARKENERFELSDV